MPRTTIDFHDEVLRALKTRAAREGTTLSRLVNALVRIATARPRRRAPLRLRTFRGGKGLQPGARLDDRDALHDLMDGR
jgi:hypothetical protein